MSGRTRLTAEVHDFDLSIPLQSGESWETPVCVGVFTSEGFGEASRILHRYQTEYVLPQDTIREPLPVQYNSWSAYGFSFTEEQQYRLAERAAAIGAEVFVLDDGWFADRDDDSRGLGDWYPSPTKFPRGLDPLIAHVRSLVADGRLYRLLSPTTAHAPR